MKEEIKKRVEFKGEKSIKIPSKASKIGLGIQDIVPSHFSKNRTFSHLNL